MRKNNKHTSITSNTDFVKYMEEVPYRNVYNASGEGKHFMRIAAFSEFEELFPKKFVVFI